MKLNTRYQIANLCFFGLLAVVLGYGSNYMLSLGFSNSEIGVIMAAFNIISVFLQPTLASLNDKFPSLSLQKLINICMLIVLGCSIVLYFMGIAKGSHIVIVSLLILIYALGNSIAPLINSLAFLYDKQGVVINFGVARGLGSLSYACVSLILGYIVNWFSPSILPLFYALFAALTIFIVYGYKLNGVKGDRAHEEQKSKENQLSFFEFIVKYKKLIIMLCGFVLVYTAHMIINNFYIQIVTSLKGTSVDMGNMIFIAAMCELPAMFGFTWLSKKIGITNLMRIAIVFYILKHALTFVAINVTMLYIAAFLQMLAYAVFTPAAVYYVNMVVNDQDQVMAQSVNGMSMTIGGVVGSLLGGVIMDLMGVKNVLLIGLILSICGGFIVFMNLEKVNKKKLKEEGI